MEHIPGGLSLCALRVHVFRARLLRLFMSTFANHQKARASESTSEMVVTDVIQLTTTVCPVAEAESVSSAALAAHSKSASLTSTAAGVVQSSSYPLGTGVSAKGAEVSPSASAASTAAGVASYPMGTGVSVSAPLGTGVSTKAAEFSTSTVYATSIYTITSCAATVTNCPARTSTAIVPVSEVVVPVSASSSESVVLTYTLGSGTSTTVVTTTIVHAITATVYATSAAAGVAASETGPTTTIFGTSTSTRYVTVVPASSGSAGAAGGSIAAASGGASGSCTPVTVTIALSTVTVVSFALYFLSNIS